MDPEFLLPTSSQSVVSGFEHMVLTKGTDPLDKFVARLNIEHYRKKLATEADEAQRKMLQGLLAEEEAKLAALERKPEKEQGA